MLIMLHAKLTSLCHEFICVHLQAAGTTCLSLYCGFDPTADSLHLGRFTLQEPDSLDEQQLVALCWHKQTWHEHTVAGAQGSGTCMQPDHAQHQQQLAHIFRQAAQLAAGLAPAARPAAS